MNVAAPLRQAVAGAALAMALGLLLLGSPSSPLVSAAASDWLTYGFDTSRTGSNPGETTLTPANVGQLKLAWATDTFSNITGQPLYVSGVQVAGVTRDLVIVGNESGWLVAIEAQTGAKLWSKQFGTSGIACTGYNRSNGISGTPVIDKAAGVVYAADGAGQLHKVGLGTGNDVAGWPVTWTTNTAKEQAWSALTLDGNLLYLEVGSRCSDQPPFSGRVMQFNATSGALIKQWLVVPSGQGDGGGIWGYGGVALNAANHRVYVATGNAVGGTSDEAGWGNAVVELDSNLNVLAADHAMQIPDRGDFDYGSSPTVFQGAGCPAQFSVLNKIGDLFLYDRDTIAAGLRQDLHISGRGDPGQGLNGTSAWWPSEQLLISPVTFPDAAAGKKAGLIAHKLGADCRLTQVWNTQLSAAGVYFSPPMLANGVAYLGTGENATVVAVDAKTGAKLWESPKASKPMYAPPIVVNGTLYVGGWDQNLYAYRLNGTGGTPTPTPTPPPGDGNLVQNGSFEANTAGWVSWQGALQRVLTGVNSQDGNYGALVSFSGCPGCTSFNIVAGHPIVTNPKQGDTYTATAYVKSEDVAGRKVKLEIRETGGVSPVQATSSTAATVSNLWSKLTVSRTITANDRTGLIINVTQFGAQPSDDFIVDAVSVVKTGPNLVTNPSYETSLTGWYAWQSTASRISGGHTDSFAAQVTYACPSGSTCTAYTWGNVSSQVPNPPPGGAYRATIWVKGQGSAIGKTAQLTLRENGGAGASAATSGAAVTLASGWQQLTVSRTIAASDRTGLEMYVAQANAAGGDSIVVDDASIIKTN